MSQVLITLNQAQAKDRQLDLKVWAILSIILIAMLIERCFSVIDDARRAGLDTASGEIILWETSSILTLIGLLPILLWVSRRMNVNDLVSWRSLGIYSLAAVAFSIVHVNIMVAIRKILTPLIWEHPYDFAPEGRSLVTEVIYELRKDLISFVLFLLLIYMFRHIAELRQELFVAREEAQRTSRLTLKCGGRSIFLDAHSVNWAKAAGNYVEIGTDHQTHLARITLASLQEQLSAAGANMARVHRSWLVSRDKVVELQPVRDGDQQAKLTGGEVVPVSRRYKDALV